jgi:hypothetical protein
MRKGKTQGNDERNVRIQNGEDENDGSDEEVVRKAVEKWARSVD